MVATNANDAEILLWEEFDAATVDTNGTRLKRKRKETEQSSKSLRKDFRVNLEGAMTNGYWNQPNEDGVKLCARKAGKTARLIADQQGVDTCDGDLFNLAASIIRMCQEEDYANGTGPTGIIC